MTKLLVLIGPAGCGKTTFCKSLDDSWVRVSRDDMREMLCSLDEQHSSYYDRKDVHIIESIINGAVNQTILGAKAFNKNVVIDATNLKTSYIRSFLAMREDFPGLWVEFKVFDTPKEECLRRQIHRERQVPAEVVEKQFQQLESLLTSEIWLRIQENLFEE